MTMGTIQADPKPSQCHPETWRLDPDNFSQPGSMVPTPHVVGSPWADSLKVPIEVKPPDEDEADEDDDEDWDEDDDDDWDEDDEDEDDEDDDEDWNEDDDDDWDEDDDELDEDEDTV